MPLTLNVGLSKKIGQPDYGSLGASCNVEVELAHDVVFSDLESFHRHVKNAFIACRQAVNDELARGGDSSHDQAGENGRSSNGNGRRSNGRSTNGYDRGESNGNDQASPGRASQKQIDYARQLAGQIRGVGVRRLDVLANRMFSKPLIDLSSLDASGLIDTLKEIKAGKIDADAAFAGAAA